MIKKRGIECATIQSIPSDALHWFHLPQPALSTQVNRKDPFNGSIGHLTEVQRTIRLNDQEPHRSFKAQYHDYNGFQLSEYWMLPNKPQLSQTYYSIAFTDKDGHNPIKQMYISMPPVDLGIQEQFKNCALQVENDENHRYFTLDVYVKAL